MANNLLHASITGWPKGTPFEGSAEMTIFPRPSLPAVIFSRSSLVYKLDGRTKNTRIGIETESRLYPSP